MVKVVTQADRVLLRLEELAEVLTGTRVAPSTLTPKPNSGKLIFQYHFFFLLNEKICIFSPFFPAISAYGLFTFTVLFARLIPLLNLFQSFRISVCNSGSWNALTSHHILTDMHFFSNCLDYDTFYLLHTKVLNFLNVS